MLSASVEAAAVLAASDVVHEGVVRHGYGGIDPSARQQVVGELPGAFVEV